MGREKRSLPAAVVGGPKERHRRAQRSQYDPTAPVPQGFVAKPAQPKTKHHTYFEFVENKDKKKKLEFQITTKKTPPPGFEYVPAGNPELTTACKELSREKDAMIFIVSSFLKNAKEDGSNILAHQVHRSGHHIRATIVEEARAGLGQTLNRKTHASGGLPEPIPKSQEEYDRQVDAALRDLFPRIPNTDRQIIIEHAFRRGATFKGEKPVGLSTDITLARRVQLAVLAHIRHTHTRYDTLLKETTWQNARKVVEALCLDTLVKWRGDEESGRDQLDEILREVVVISDSEGEDSDEESDDSSIAEVEPPPMPTAPSRLASNTSGQVGPGRRQSPRFTSSAKGPATPVRGNGKVKKAKRKTSAEKKGQRGFKRYHQAWQEALQRSREEQDPAPPTPVARNHQYSHAPPPGGPASYRGDEFPTASQLRITLDRAGPAPNENGYVGSPHQPPRSQFMSLGRQSFSPAPRQPMHNKVKSPFHEPRATTPRPLSTVTNRLQDLLVQSIEPASPETMRPSFVRAVPPRVQGFRDEPLVGPRIQHPVTMPSPSRGLDVRDEPIRMTRPIGNEHFAYGDRPYSPHLDGPRQPVLRHEQDFASSHNGSRLGVGPAYRNDARPHGMHDPAANAVSRRPFEEAPRPGSRGAPVFLETRGGFYERVPVRPNGSPLPQNVEVVEYRRPTREVVRTPDQRPVVWQEGPRIIRETQGAAGVEIIPISRAHPHEIRPRPIAEPPRPLFPTTGGHGDAWRYVERGPAPGHQDAPGLEARPIASDRLEPRYEPYQEIRHDQRPPAGYQQQEPMQRQYRNEPLAPDNRPRAYPLHPHQPENIIVLE
ncbi:hypothetical protein ACJZ2D_006463 [Fusarium nematophilum]